MNHRAELHLRLNDQEKPDTAIKEFDKTFYFNGARDTVATSSPTPVTSGQRF